MFWRKGKPRASEKPPLTADEVAQILLQKHMILRNENPEAEVLRPILGSGPPSDIGEADVDVACRWVDENIPEDKQIVDVEFIGETEGGPMYRVIYEI